ncbi:hypothetical protein AB0395_47150 [Streptosporangium sp. NPDC051023]|uniref:hypothetical protein n=1 Tax=Streptosporangium sp. NPDC051023 TaxID=3155410 RepID=UPI00344C6CF5
MYTTLPPEDSTAGSPAVPGILPLRLDSCRHLLLPPGLWTASEDDRRTVTQHYEEMSASYGLSLPFEELASSRRNTFADIAAAVLPRDTGVPDVIMMAHLTPDYDARRSPTSELVGLLGDGPLPYRVSDEGTVSPFTALRLAGEHARWDPAERVLLLIMDQADTRPVRPVPATAVVERDSVVALSLSRSTTTAGIPVRRLTGVTREQLRDALAGIVGETLPGETPYALVLGAGLAGLPAPAGARDVLHARPGLGCTGVWAALAEHAPRLRAGGHPVLLAEYDPMYGFLAVAVLAAKELPGAKPVAP